MSGGEGGGAGGGQFPNRAKLGEAGGALAMCRTIGHAHDELEGRGRAGLARGLAGTQGDFDFDYAKNHDRA